MDILTYMKILHCCFFPFNDHAPHKQSSDTRSLTLTHITYTCGNRNYGNQTLSVWTEQKKKKKKRQSSHNFIFLALALSICSWLFFCAKNVSGIFVLKTAERRKKTRIKIKYKKLSESELRLYVRLMTIAYLAHRF